MSFHNESKNKHNIPPTRTEATIVTTFTTATTTMNNIKDQITVMLRSKAAYAPTFCM